MPEEVVAAIAVTLLFGGGTLFLLSISPVGKAIAARISGRHLQDSEKITKELQDLRQLRHELRAEARISKEMAGTDTKAQEAEFLEYARTTQSNSEFDSLVGLGAKTAAAPAPKEKGQALPE